MNISVANGCHRDDRPVQGCGHRVKHRPLLVLLPDVSEAAEYQHAHDDDQHEQPQLLVAVLQCHPQCLEPRYVAGQLKNPRNKNISVQVNFPFTRKEKTLNGA